VPRRNVKGNRADRRHVQGHDRCGQRRIRQGCRGGLRDVVDRPPEKIDERLRLRLGHPARIDVQFLVHQEVRERRDRVAARARGVRDRYLGPIAASGGQTSCGARRRGGRRVQVGQDVAPRCVLDPRVAHAVLDHVCEFDVSDRAGLAFDGIGDPLVLWSAASDGPRDELPLPHLRRELGADLGQVVREDEGRAARVRAVLDEDRGVREHDAGVD